MAHASLLKNPTAVTRINAAKAITLEYEGLKVHFTDAAWFNATEAAAKYGKRVDTWLKTKETRRYIAALEGVDEDKLNTTNWRYLKTTKGRIGGTWLHPRLAVVFARWLDVRFALWCDEQIFALLRGTHTHANPPRQELIEEKKDNHHVMMDAKKFLLEEILGQETHSADFLKENFFCNRALTGVWGPLDQSTLDNYDLKLLAAIRNYNAVLIPHFWRQTEPGPGNKTRRDMMDEFVAAWRLKHPRAVAETGH